MLLRDVCSWLGLCLALGACGTTTPPAGGPAPPAASSLQADGSVRFALESSLPDGAREGLLSAPLLPNMTVFQHLGGVGYPATPAAREEVVDQHVFTFGYLLDACRSKYPNIKLPTPPEELSPKELAINYNQVARCGYEEYGAKPYWIPQLLGDVDLCARKLGAGWRLPTAADLATFQEADFQRMRDVLTGAALFDPLNGGTASWGVFYFSLKVYLRASDGSLLVGDLNPGVAARTRPLGVTGEQLKDLLIDGKGDNTALRCIRSQ